MGSKWLPWQPARPQNEARSVFSKLQKTQHMLSLQILVKPQAPFMAKVELNFSGLTIAAPA